jgi:hypothetical protein
VRDAARDPSSPASGAAGAAPGSHAVGGRSADPAALETSTSDERRLVLSDLLNRVLDRGLMITGSVTLAVADIDLVQLDLNLVLTAAETATRHRSKRTAG